MKLALATILSMATLFISISCSTSEDPTGNPNDVNNSSVMDPVPAEWIKDAMVYHAYVRSFMDSDGDGIGDFNGLRSKIDYIEELGANTILLLPIVNNASDEYGGYAPTDYFAVETDYGTMADFDAFLSSAKERGLRVLLDLPLDLAADTHPFFVSAREDTASEYRDWFVWREPPCPETVGVFGLKSWKEDSENAQCYWTKWLADVPEWNFNNPDVQEHLISVAMFWLAKGVDGFRLDSAAALADDTTGSEPIYHSEQTHAFWHELTSRMQFEYPNAVVIAEIFDHQQDIVSAYYEDGIDMTFDYPLYLSGLLQAMHSGAGADAIDGAVSRKLDKTPTGYSGGLFLGNHDVPGASPSELPGGGGRFSDTIQSQFEKEILGAMLLLTLPGTPFIYYGQEIGLTAGTDRAETHSVRNPMQWTTGPGRGFTTADAAWRAYSDDAMINVADQIDDDTSLLSAYKALTTLRAKRPSLRRGEYLRLPTNSSNVFAYLRTLTNEQAANGQMTEEHSLIICNFSDQTETVLIDFSPATLTSANLTELIFGLPLEAITSENSGTWPFAIGPWGSVIADVSTE